MTASLRLRCCVAWAVLLAGAAPASDPPRDPPPAPVEVALDASGRAVLEHLAEITGKLNAWVESEDFDPRIEIRAGESALARDDDSGGGTTAFVTLDVEAGQALEVVVTDEAGGAGGRARVHLVPRFEHDALRAALGAAEAERRACGELAARQRCEEVRERLRAAIERVLVTPGVEHSHGAQVFLFNVLAITTECEDAETSLRASRAADELAAGRYPPLSRAVVLRRAAYASTLWTNGDGRAGFALLEPLVPLLLERSASGDLQMTIAMINCASIAKDLGQARLARDLALAALPPLERALGPDAPQTHSLQRTIAHALLALGEPGEAREILARSVESLEGKLPADSLELALARESLGGALFELGDYALARTAHERALAARERVLRHDHPSVLTSRINIGNAFKAAWELDAAAEYLEPAWRMLADRPPGDINHDGCAAMLGELTVKQRDFARACDLLSRQLALLEDQVGCEAPRTLEARQLLAQARTGAGDLEGALDLELETFDALSRTMPPESPRLQDSLCQQVRIHALAAEPARAAGLVPDLAARIRRHLGALALTLAPREAEAAAADRAHVASDLFSVLPAGTLDRELFELVEGLRGIGARALAVAHSAGGERGAEVAAARARLREATGSIAALVRAGVREKDGLRRLLDEKERAQRELSAALLEAADAAALEPPGADEVASVLAEDHAAIGYWTWQAKDLREHPDARGEPRLSAFVLRSRAAPVRVDLGALAPVAELVGAWRAAVAAEDEAAERAAGSALRAIVVDPLRAVAPSARRWTVAPDGPLHLVPLDALPLDRARGDARAVEAGSRDGSLADARERDTGSAAVVLGDEIAISVLPSLAEIARRRPEVPRSPTLLALGGIDYGPLDALAFPEALSDALRGGPWEQGFRALPQSGLEVREVAAILGAAIGSELEVVELTGADATREALLARAGSAGWLHVATHGFVAADPEPAGAARELAPLVLCGLALAGANQGGVITAEEIAALDLSSCGLAVLSACETNVGESIAGQGLASFQKALHAAGARTVVTSSWRVPDQPTRELMAKFYRAMLPAGRGPAEALWVAKRALRAKRASTRDWGAWVASGG